MKVLIPDTLDYLSRPEFPSGVAAITYEVASPFAEEHFDADVLVVWGTRVRHMRTAAPHLRNLQLVQTINAGPDSALAVDFAPSVVIACGRGLHDIPVAEHTLALVLAAARRLDLQIDNQRRRYWSDDLGGLGQVHHFPGLGTLHGKRVLIWGFGSIAQRLSPMLKLLGANVTGVARTAGARSGTDVVTEDQGRVLLADTDLVISLLPATTTTEGFFDEQFFAALPGHAWFVNVGRGRTVNESDLVKALESGALAGAALDVTAHEPLPEGSPLWTAPNVIITPHAAGGRPVGAYELVLENIKALREGTELRNVVDRT